MRSKSIPIQIGAALRGSLRTTGTAPRTLAAASLALVLASAASGQLSITTGTDEGHTPRVLNEDNNDLGVPRYHNWDLTKSTSGDTGWFLYQAISAIDSQGINGTESRDHFHRYHATIDIDAPNQCWTLEVDSSLKGRIGAWDDGGKWAASWVTQIDGSSSPPASTGGISVGAGLGVTNSDDNEGDDDDSVSLNYSSAATYAGFGSGTLTLSYDFRTTTSSTTNLLFGGDEGITEFGLAIPNGSSAFENGRNPESDWGHLVQLSLTRISPPSISTICPSLTNACVGEHVELEIDATGDDLFYTWYDEDDVEVASGFGLSTLVFDPVTLTDDGVYTCVVSNECGTATSCGLVLDVGAAPTISSQPQAVVTKCSSALPQNVFTLVASGTPSPTYTWYGPGPGTPNAIAGGPSLSPTLQLVVTPATAGTYYCVVETECSPPAISNTVELVVHSPPTALGQPPTTYTACESSTPQNLFSFTATGTPAPTYTWYGPNSNTIVAGTGSTLVRSVTTADAGSYFCRASNGCLPDLDSVVVVLSVSELPEITTQPVDVTLCQSEDEQDVFTVAAAGTGPLTYAWYGPGAGGPQVGSEATLRMVVTPANAGVYHVKVGNDCNPPGVTSSFVSLIVKPQPVVSVSVSPDPVAAAECGASDVTLTASVTSAPTPYTYRWYKDTPGNQVGGNSAVLHLGAVQEAATYWLEVQSADGCIGSSDVVPLAQGQDGVNARWTGPDGGGLLTFGSWQRLVPATQACGNWSGAPGALGVCPPPGFARFQNAGGSLNTAVLGDDEEWNLQQLEIEGLSSAAQQRLSLLSNAAMSAELCATVKPHGILELLGGALTGGLVTVKNGGSVEGHGQLAATGSLDNFGEIRGSGPTSARLDVALSSMDPWLHNHGGSALRAQSGSAAVQVLGSVENGVAVAPGGLVEVQPNGRLTVTGTVVNHGHVTVTHSGGGAQANLSFDRFENRVGVPLGCSSCPTLEKGVTLDGGRLTATGVGILENYAGARLHGRGLIDSPVTNSGRVRVTGPPDSVLTVVGCFTNTSTGTVLIDFGTKLVLTNDIFCAANLGTITTTGLGECVGCSTAVATLSMQGNFEGAPGSQLHLNGGAVELLGNFTSHITEPYAYDLDAARIELAGYAIDGAQELSTMAPDLGPIGDFASQRAMAIGELVVSANPAMGYLAPRPDETPATLYVKHVELAAGAALDLGSTTVYAESVTLQPGATLFLSSGRLYYGTIEPANPCASGQVVGSGCATRLAPMPAPDCNDNGIADVVEIANATQPDCNQNGVPDACDIELGRSLDQDHDEVPDDCEMLHADRPWISASQGGRQELSLHAGAAHAGRLYSVWASAKPVRPGSLSGGAFVPSPLSSFGLLDGQGRATETLEFEAGALDASLVGRKLYHRFAVIHGGAVVATSNMTWIHVRP